VVAGGSPGRAFGGLVVVTATSSSDLMRDIIAEIRDESVDSGSPESVFRHRGGVDARRRR
jgi:hypothetical protein